MPVHKAECIEYLVFTTLMTVCSSLYKCMCVVVTVKVSSSLYDDAISTELFFSKRRVEFGFLKDASLA